MQRYYVSVFFEVYKATIKSQRYELLVNNGLEEQNMVCDLVVDGILLGL